MTATAARKKLIDETKANATALATRFADRAAAPDATPVEQVQAQTAVIIIRIAEAAAGHISREEADQITEDLKTWAREQDQKIADVVRQAGPIREVIDHGIALSEVKQARFSEYLDEHRLKAWRQACDDLSTLEIPLSGLHQPPQSKQ